MSGLRATGLAGLYAAVVGPVGAVILMYHSVAGEADAAFIDPDNRIDPAEFERQMGVLAEERSVVSMDEVAEAVRGRRRLPPAAVAVTFDDGYLDNLRVVAPVLTSLGLPATLYLPTSYIDTGEPQWIDRLCHAFRARTIQFPVVPGFGPGPIALDRAETDRGVYSTLRERLRVSEPGARERLLSGVERGLGSPPIGPRLTMRWDDVRTLVREHPGFSIGAHTRSHADLSVTPAESLEDEIAGSINDIERHAGVRPRHFSFPYGRWCRGAAAILRREGIVSAVASGALPRARPGQDPLRLSRVGAPGCVAELKSLTHPAYPDLPMNLFGRA